MPTNQLTRITEDVRSFDTFVTDHRRKAWAYAYSLTHNAHAADDIVADVLGRIWRRWDTDRPTRPDAYLMRAVLNAVIDRRRSEAREQRALQRLHSRAASGTPSPEDEVIATIAVEDLLATLTDAQRQLMQLRYVEDMSEAATAAEIGVPTGTLKSRSSRTTRRMRTAISYV